MSEPKTCETCRWWGKAWRDWALCESPKASELMNAVDSDVETYKTFGCNQYEEKEE